MRGASLRSAIALGNASRRDYYRRRLQRLNRDNPEHRDYAVDALQWMRGSNAPLSGGDLIRRLVNAHGLSRREAYDFLDAAKHSGLLAEGPDGAYTTPIPSIAGHLLGERLPDIQEPHPAPGHSPSHSATHGP